MYEDFETNTYFRLAMYLVIISVLLLFVFSVFKVTSEKKDNRDESVFLEKMIHQA